MHWFLKYFVKGEGREDNSFFYTSKIFHFFTFYGSKVIDFFDFKKYEEYFFMWPY